MNEPAAEKKNRPLRDMVEALFRHRKKAAAFFLAVTLAALILLAFTPATYTSTSKLIVHRGRESVFVDPTAGGASLPLYKEWESEINTELEILSSRELVTEVVYLLGPDAFLKERPPDESGRLAPVRKFFNPVRVVFLKISSYFSPDDAAKNPAERQKAVDKAVQMVEKNLEIGVRHKSDIITVSYTADSPELARQVVSALVSNYLEKRIDLHQIPGGYEFFTQQTEVLRDELEENEARIQRIKKESGMDSVSDNRLVIQTSLEQMQSLRLGVQAELAAAEARVNTIRAMLAKESPDMSGSRDSAILDPVEYKRLQATLRLEDTNLAALVAQDRTIGTQLGQLRSALQDIEKLEPSIRRLEREQDLLEQKYRKYSENREQARINQELETKKISNITIVQHATLPDESNPSGKLMKLAAALFLGFFGAIGIAFGADCMDPSLHSEADVSVHVKRKTLIELPKLHSKQLDPAYSPPRRKQRRSHWILHSGKNAAADGDNSFQELYFRFLSMEPAAADTPLVIGLTSSTGGEGVSTIAGKLAAAFSRDERFPNVLLLDANLTEHSEQMIKQRTDLPFSSHKIRDEDASGAGLHASVNASTVTRFLEQARRGAYQIIVVDIPPIDEGNYAIRVAADTDQVGLVAACGRTPWRSVRRTADLLENAGAPLEGVILNRQQYTMPKWIYRKL